SGSPDRVNHCGDKAMFIVCLSRVEWHFDGFTEWNYPGTLVLLFILLALLGVALGSGALSQPFTRRNKVPSLSNFSTNDPGNTAPAKRKRKVVLFQETSQRELRDSMRREGDLVEVLITRGKADAEPMMALVLNRSRGGLLISAPEAAEVGCPLYVRAVDAPAELDWVPIQIRYCRERDGRWLWGCKFMRE